MSYKKNCSILLILAFIFFTCFSLILSGEEISPDPITIEKIFGSKEYKSKSFGPFRWDKTGHSYTLLKPSKKLPISPFVEPVLSFIK